LPCIVPCSPGPARVLKISCNSCARFSIERALSGN
jgi:hypothetical protein